MTATTEPDMDIYDDHIASLLAAPDFTKAVLLDWENAAPLFLHCTTSGDNEWSMIPGQRCGCLTQIASSRQCVVPGRPDLTEAIRNDGRIPWEPTDITPDDLPVFAEWQRRLDREIRT